MSKIPGTFRKTTTTTTTTATSPTPLGNGGEGLNTGPWGRVQIRLNDGGVIFAQRGNNDADLERIPETCTNTVKRWRRHFCPGGKMTPT